MPVTGGADVAAALRRMPERAKAEVKEAVRTGAGAVLADMQRLTPRSDDPPHVRDALTVQYENDIPSARVGLPTQGLADAFSYFRVLDGGTQGQPALRIRERALDGNRDEIERAVREAMARVLPRSHR